jgi:hypothetical protein
VLTLVAAPLSLVVGASPATAGLGLSCPTPTYQPFRAWSDFAQYAQVPDGGFEAGGAGWKFSGGAKVVSGNNPFFLRSSGDRSSLLLPAGSSAMSPPMCISLASTKMRFVVGGPKGSTVKVRVHYRGILSRLLGALDGGTVTSGGEWQPSPEIGMLGGLLPLLTQSVQFQLVATSGSPQVDDVFLDPWKIG